MRSGSLTLGAAPSPLQSLPALDIEELLDEQPWEKRALDSTECKLLKKALDFLEKVQVGGDIVERTAASGTIVPDIVSLDAYEYTRRAMESSLVSAAPTFDQRQAIIAEAHAVIQALLQHQDKGKPPQAESITRTARLFWALAQYSHSRGSAAPMI
jgi:hypothetical protein